MRPPRDVVWLAWAITLLASILPEIVWQSATGSRPAWLLPARLILLGVAAAAGFAWDTARPLRRYCLLLMALLAVQGLQGVAESAPRWQNLWGGGFSGSMLGRQVLRLAGAGALVAILLLLRYSRRAFYLRPGRLNAPAAPVRWLGIDRPIGWARLGAISALCISLGTLAFLVIGGRPSLAMAARVMAALPVVLALAAMNAFSEEMCYRGALLAPAVAAIGGRRAILLTAVLFGIGHFYGVPYGPIGVAMAGILGWFLGKCMVETEGLAWPWFIHFLQDVAIFTFMAAGAVRPGG